jgi:hypothetical protein
LHFLRYSGNPVKIISTNKNIVYFDAKEGGFTINEGIKVKRDVMEEIRLLYNLDIKDIEPYGNEKLILSLLNNFIFYHTNSKHFTEFLETIRKIANI